MASNIFLVRENLSAMKCVESAEEDAGDIPSRTMIYARKEGILDNQYGVYIVKIDKKGRIGIKPSSAA